LRALGVDFGGKRIGIAVAEVEARVASPRAAIAASGALRRDAAAISEIFNKEQATIIVVGEPLGAEGEPTKMSKICRKLGEEIALLGHEVRFVDESMTSVAATADMRAMDWTAAQRRRHIDSEAACRILERFFDASES
jgi:putative transcription antitermination factor YqgF